LTARRPAALSRRSHPTAASVFVTLALLMAVAGCSGAATGSRTSGQAGSSVPSTRALVGAEGGTAEVDVSAVPTTLNPHTTAGDDAATLQAAAAVWPQVFSVGPKVAPHLNTDLVQSAEVVNLDPQTIVYQINPRAVWSDGVPITVDDFTYAWAMQRGGAVDGDGAPASVASTAGYRDIASVTGSNAGKTVTVVFQHPYADWPSLFSDLLPGHIAQRVGWNHGFDRFDSSVFVSGGPWILTSWVPGVRLTLARNPKWWGAAPHLDGVVVKVQPTAGATAADLVAGRAQVGGPAAYDSSFLGSVSSSPLLSSQSTLGTTILQLEFNVRQAPFNSAAVRQGIGRSLDRPAIVAAAGQPLDPLVGLDNNHLFANGQTAYADNAAGFHTADPATASQLLTQGGLVATPAATWTLHGTPVSLRVAWASDDPFAAAAGPVVASQLEAAGFAVTSEPLSSTALSVALASGSFDLALAPVAASAYPTTMAKYFSTLEGGPGTGVSQDWSGFDDPKVDALFTSASRELAGQSAVALYQQIDQELWQELPTLPLFAEPQVLVSSVSLLGPRPNPGGSGLLWEAATWFYLVPAPPKGATAHALGVGVRTGPRAKVLEAPS
jgi:glutathione transport system substrate-binding protein